MEIEKLIQEDKDDGVQTLIVVMTDGRRVNQKWEWPTFKYGDGTDGYTYAAYEALQGAKADPNDIYLVITKLAKQVEGTVLKMELIDGTD